MTIEQIEQAATGRLPHTEEIAAQDRYALGKNVGYKRGFISGARYVIQQLYNTPLDKVAFELVEFMEQEENRKEND